MLVSFVVCGFLLLSPAIYEVYYYSNRHTVLSNDVYWKTIVRLLPMCSQRVLTASTESRSCVYLPARLSAGASSSVRLSAC